MLRPYVVNARRAAPRRTGHAGRSERTRDDGLGGRDEAMDTSDRKSSELANAISPRAQDIGRIVRIDLLQIPRLLKRPSASVRRAARRFDCC
jgi:hypothetical protein